MLSEKQPYVRSIDIATELGFSKPSVSVAMKNLRVNNLILVNDEGHITLTDEGRRIAETIYERHTALSKWLMDLGVSEQTALDDACRIEHDISAESFAAIKEHIKNILPKRKINASGTICQQFQRYYDDPLKMLGTHLLCFQHYFYVQIRLNVLHFGRLTKVTRAGLFMQISFQHLPCTVFSMPEKSAETMYYLCP